MESFLAAIQSGSITSAASNLYISPQGLSSLLKKIENELGVSLFERRTNGVIPTEYGKLVAEKSKEIIKLYREMLCEIGDYKRLQNGMIRMISAYGVLRKMTPEFIFEFNDKNSEVHLDYMEFPDRYIDEMVANEKVDIGFTIGPVDNEQFNSILIYEEDVMLLVNDDNELYNKEKVSFKDIEGHDFIVESDMFKLHKNFIHKCEKHGFLPNIVFNTSGFMLCHKLCAQGKGLSLTLQSNYSDMVVSSLKLIPFDEDFKWQIYMITKKDKNNVKAVQTLMEHALNWKIE